MNGDASEAIVESPPELTSAKHQTAMVTFPPTPESPLTSADYTMDENVDPETMGPAPSQVLFASPTHDPMAPPLSSPDENGPLEGTIPDNQLRNLLKAQLEYYFSRQALEHCIVGL